MKLAKPAPPTVTIKPSAKPGNSTKAAYSTYIRQHSSMAGYANAIYKAANDYGVDPVYYASLLWKESFSVAKATGQAVETIESPTGAGYGVAQINPKAHIGEPIPWAPGKRITQEDLANPAFSIRWGAYYLSQGVAKYGSYEQAYRNFYNPGYTGPVFNDIPATYVPTTTASSPTDVAQRGAEVKIAKGQIDAGTTTWAVANANGRVKWVTTRNKLNTDLNQIVPNAPKGTLTIFGQPLTQSSFLQQYAGLADDYVAYTGKRPSFAQVAQVIKGGLSQYEIRSRLANSPSFVNSPVWKQNAPGYEDVFKQIYGQDAQVDKKAIQYAITNNLGSGGFAGYLRAQPNYKKSNEFASNFAGNENVFAQIYGSPDSPEAHQAIEQATLHGWDQNTFAKYLRSQPNYTSSPEYLSKATAFLDAMGLVFGGAQAVLRPTDHPPQQTGGQGDLPPTLGLEPGFTGTGS